MIGDHPNLALAVLFGAIWGVLLGAAFCSWVRKKWWKK